VVAAAPPAGRARLSFLASAAECGSDGGGSCDSARRLPASERFVVMDDEKLLVRACFLPVILLGARAVSELLLLSSSFRSVFLCTRHSDPVKQTTYTGINLFSWIHATALLTFQWNFKPIINFFSMSKILMHPMKEMELKANPTNCNIETPSKPDKLQN